MSDLKRSCHTYRVFRQKLDTFGRLQLGRWPSYHAGHHLIGCRISRSFFWGAARQGPTSFDRAIAFFLKKSGFFCKFLSNSSLIFLGVYSNCIFGFVGQSGITWLFRLSFLKMIHLPNSHTFFLKLWKCVTIVKYIFFLLKECDDSRTILRNF